MLDADNPTGALVDLAALLEQVAIAVGKAAAGLENAQEALGPYTTAMLYPQLPDLVAEVKALAAPIAEAHASLSLAQALGERAQQARLQ